MRIVDYETNRSLNDVEIVLTPDEISDLSAYLQKLSESPCIGRVYLSELRGSRLEREVTVSVDPHSRRVYATCPMLPAKAAS